MRKIVVMIGSDSDLAQCVPGLEYLGQMIEKGVADVLEVITNSIHRNTLSVLGIVSELLNQGIDLLVVGAGMANHVTGTVSKFLRNTLHDTHVVVVGVAFEDKDNPENTKAAILSITQVPGTQVVFDDFVGEKGFLEACKFAVEGDLPSIKLGPSKPVVRRTHQEALVEARERRREKEGIK